MADMTGDMGRMSPEDMREAAFLVLLQEQVRSLTEQTKDDRDSRKEAERSRQEREERREQEQKKRDDALFVQIRALNDTVQSGLQKVSDEVAQTYVRIDVYDERARQTDARVGTLEAAASTYVSKPLYEEQNDRIRERVKSLEDDRDSKRKQVSQLWYGLVAAGLTAVLIPVLLLLLNVPQGS